MAAGAEIREGSHPEGRENQGITSEELSAFVPRYHVVIHEHLYARGILKEGEQLEFTFPALPHPNSEAEYLYEDIIGDDWVFIAFIRPNRETSRHKHPNEEIEIEEDYVLLAGKMFLHLGEDESSEVELTETNDFVTIPPNTFHRSTTDGHFALYIARMRGGSSKIPRDKLHVPF